MRPLLFIAPALIAGAIVAAACEDGSSDVVTRRPTPEGPTPALQGDGKAFFDLLTAGFDATYKIEYRTSGDSVVVYNTRVLSRVDTLTSGSDEPASLFIGRDEETDTVGCTNKVTGWECIRIDALGYSLVALAGPNVLPTIWDVGAAAVTVVEPREIAGQQATCYQYTPEEAVDQAEYCLSADGVPLFSSSANGDVEAVSYSSDVDDSDFEPPAAP